MSLFDKLFGPRLDDRLEDRSPEERHAAVADSQAAYEAGLLLRAPSALAQLSESEAFTVVSFMSPRRFPAGTVLIREGESGDSGFMVLVLDGEVTVERLRTSHRSAVTISVLGRGSLIGEMALVDGEARSATCTASTDVSCAVLTREALEKLIEEEPSTGAKLMTAIAVRLAERLREVSQKLQVTSKLVLTLQQEIDALMPTPDKRLK
ncbi:MAG: cyclic nucleotide-binding domain-containing protein [Hydrogenophaga sp.]|nr:cyclic nucleotide-binding domain-containing protein [Hydrogenophaga sp.]